MLYTCCVSHTCLTGARARSHTHTHTHTHTLAIIMPTRCLAVSRGMPFAHATPPPPPRSRDFDLGLELDRGLGAGLSSSYSSSSSSSSGSAARPIDKTPTEAVHTNTKHNKSRSTEQWPSKGHMRANHHGWQHILFRSGSRMVSRNWPFLH